MNKKKRQKSDSEETQPNKKCIKKKINQNEGETNNSVQSPDSKIKISNNLTEQQTMPKKTVKESVESKHIASNKKNHKTHTSRLDSKSTHICKKKSVNDIAVQSEIINKIIKSYKLKPAKVVLIKDNVENMRNNFLMKENNKETVKQNGTSKETCHDTITCISNTEHKSPIKLSQDINDIDNRSVTLAVSQILSQFYDTTDSETTDTELKNLMKEDIGLCNIEQEDKTEITHSNENLHFDDNSCQNVFSKTGEKTTLTTISFVNQNSCINKIQSKDSLSEIDIVDNQKNSIEETANNNLLSEIDFVKQISNNMENTKKRKRIINNEILEYIMAFNSEYYLIRDAKVFYHNEIKLRKTSFTGSEMSLISSTDSFCSSTISLNNRIYDNRLKENQALYEDISSTSETLENESVKNSVFASDLKSNIATTSFCTKSSCISNEMPIENMKEKNVGSTSNSNTITSFHMTHNRTLSETEFENSKEGNLMSKSQFSTPTKCFSMKPNCIPEVLENIDERVKHNAISSTESSKKSVNNINNILICATQETTTQIESVSPKPSINHNSVNESVSSISNLMRGRIVTVNEINKISTYRIEIKNPLSGNVTRKDTKTIEDDTEISNLKSTLFKMNNDSRRSVTVDISKKYMKITIEPIREPSTNDSMCQNSENSTKIVNNPITPSKNIESTVFKLPKVPNLSQLNRPPDRPKNPKRNFSVVKSSKIERNDKCADKNLVRQDLNPKISWPSKPDGDCLSLYYADSLCSEATLHERFGDFDDFNETNVEIQDTSVNKTNNESMTLDSLSSAENDFDESRSTINQENCRTNSPLFGQISNTLSTAEVLPDFVKYRETSQILSSPGNSSQNLCSTDGMLSSEERNSGLHDNSNSEQQIASPDPEDDCYDDCFQRTNDANVPEERRFLLSRLSEDLSESSIEHYSELNFDPSSDTTETVSQKSTTESNRDSEVFNNKYTHFPESRQHSKPAIINTSKRLTPVNRNIVPQAQISRQQLPERSLDFSEPKKDIPSLLSLPLQHPHLYPPPLYPNRVLPLHPEVAIPSDHLQFDKHRMSPSLNHFNAINTVPYAPNSIFNNPNSVIDTNISQRHVTGSYSNFNNTQSAPSSSHSIPRLPNIEPIRNQQLQFSDKRNVDTGRTSAHALAGNSQITVAENPQLPTYPVVEPSQRSYKTSFNRNNYVYKTKVIKLDSMRRKVCHTHLSDGVCHRKCRFNHSTKNIEEFISNGFDAEELINVYYQVFKPYNPLHKIFILKIISQLGKLENSKFLFEMSKDISDLVIADKDKLEYMQNIVQSLGDALVPFNEAVSKLFEILTNHNKSIVDILLKIVLQERFIETNWELIRKLTAVDGYEMDIYDTVEILNDCCKKPKKYYLKDIFYDVLVKMAPVNVQKIDKNVLEQYLSHLVRYNLQIEHNKLKDILSDMNASDRSSGFFSQNQNPSTSVSSNHHTNSVQMQNTHTNQVRGQNAPTNRVNTPTRGVINLNQAIDTGNMVCAFEILKTAQPNDVISISCALFDAIKEKKQSAMIFYDQIMSSTDNIYDKFQHVLSLNLLVHYYVIKVWKKAFNILQKIKCKVVNFVSVKLFCNTEFSVAKRLMICCELFMWALEYRNAFNIFIDEEHPLILSQDKWNVSYNKNDLASRNNLFSSIVQGAIKNNIDTALGIVTLALSQKGYDVDIKNHFDDLLVKAMNASRTVEVVKLINKISYEGLEAMQPTTLRGVLICTKRKSDYNEFMNFYKKLCKLSVYIKYDKDSRNIRIPEDMSAEEIFCILDDFFQRVALAKEPSHTVTISVVPTSTYNLNSTLLPDILKQDNNNASIKIRNVLKNMMKPPVRIHNDNGQGSVIILKPYCFEDNIKFKRSKK